MTEQPQVETSYCMYCRKPLQDAIEINQQFHNTCYKEISTYEEDKSNHYWYYLDALSADFEDISCDQNGNIIALDLSRKGLSYIPDLDNFKTFRHLEELDLSQNYLTHVPKWVFHLPSLKKVIFPGNGFSQSLLHDILKLNAQGTAVISTGCTFNEHHQLVKLNLSFLGPTTAFNLSNDIIQYFSSLETVLLRWNRMTRFPTWIQELKHLKELNLSSNRLYGVNYLTFESKNIEAINLAENSLNYIPEWVLEQKNLVELDLTNNKIEEIPKELFKMRKLKKIFLSRAYIDNYDLSESLKKLQRKGIQVFFNTYHHDFFWLGNDE